MVSCRRTGRVSGRGIWTASCARGVETVSCGILVTIPALGFAGAGRFAFEAFEPIRGVSRGGDNESWVLLRHPQRREGVAGIRYDLEASVGCMGRCHGKRLITTINVTWLQPWLQQREMGGSINNDEGTDLSDENAARIPICLDPFTFLGNQSITLWIYFRDQKTFSVPLPSVMERPSLRFLPFGLQIASMTPS